MPNRGLFWPLVTCTLLTAVLGTCLVNGGWAMWLPVALALWTVYGVWRRLNG